MKRTPKSPLIDSMEHLAAILFFCMFAPQLFAGPHATGGNQYRADTGTAIAYVTGTIPTGVGVYFEANVSSDEGRNVRMEVELHKLPATFTGTANYVSGYVSPGTRARTVSATGLSAGNYGWRYRVVDSNGVASNWVPEGNPDFIVQAQQYPDLVISSISASPTSGKRGDSITVTVTVRNNGPGSAPASTTRIRLASSTTITTSDPLLDTFTASALSSGQSQTYTRTVTIPSGQSAGNYYMGATANADAALTEANGNNNQNTTPFMVSGGSGSVVELTGVPYIHQVYDTPNDFTGGHYSCNATAALMAIQYHNKLPAHQITCTRGGTHTSQYGFYVSSIYTYNGHTYSIPSAYVPDFGPSTLAGYYGGFGYFLQDAAGDSSQRSARLSEYIAYHGLTSSVDYGVSGDTGFTKICSEIDAGHPVVVLTSILGGHYLTCVGYISGQHTLIFNDPYGYYGASQYPNANGASVRYDWPNWNHDNPNLGAVYRIIYARGSQPVQYTVTPSAGANGSINPSTPQSVNSGGSVSFTATPANGYVVNQWLLNGASVQTGGTGYTLNNVTAAATVQVTFKTAPPDGLPTISAFAVTPLSVPLGASFTISYTVADLSGPGLKQVELWRCSQDGWSTPQTNSCSGYGPVSGTFHDTPPTVGTYWYGLHAVDTVGNWMDEGSAGLGPIPITVTDIVTPSIIASPSDGLNSSGNRGGSFSPLSKSYTVSNTGGGTLNWTAGADQNWVTVSPTSGQNSGNVSVSINANANALAAGIYPATVTFGGNGGSITRQVQLTVAAPQLAVSPSYGLISSGNRGGPFSPLSKSYTVSNTGGGTLNWTAGADQNWVTVSPASGQNSGNVSVSINANANALAAGIYPATVTFGGNGGSTTRQVKLTVAWQSLHTDFNTDGMSDILWRHPNTGNYGGYLMNGTTEKEWRSIGRVTDPNWEISVTCDLNGDGKVDIVWYHQPSGYVGVWLMNGTTLQEWRYITTLADTNWQIAGVGDFNGDQKDDLVWYHRPTGNFGVWLMNGTMMQEWKYIAQVSYLDWQIVGIADFNGDTKPDLLWWNQVTTDYGAWLMDGITKIGWLAMGAVGDLNWQITGTGDFNQDSKTDIIYRHRPSGWFGIWLMNGGQRMQWRPVRAVDLSWEIVGTR